MAEVQVVVAAGRDQELQRSTTLRANVHQVVIDDAYLQQVACSPGPVHSWCMAHRTVACMPEATSCKKGWRMSESYLWVCLLYQAKMPPWQRRFQVCPGVSTRLLMAQLLARVARFLASCMPATCMRSPT